jgi:geranylgeranyl diphosphate synthase, type I
MLVLVAGMRWLTANLEVGVMRELGPLRSRVDAVLGEFLGLRLEEVGAGAGGSGAERELVSGISDLVLRGGKRLRATLCALGWIGAGGGAGASWGGGGGGDAGGGGGGGGDGSGAGDADAIVRGGASLELLHACALIHDDVMDRSATRRGGATLHRGFAARHNGAVGWRGDSEQFGIGVAIAAGDLCLVWADKLLRESGLSAAAVERARPVYDAMRAETIRGQYLDLVTQARGGFDVDEALEVARAKTAACTTTGPLCFGGALAGADERLMAAYAAFGDALGVAFQLRDDQLGAFADPEATGKPSGDDLRDGKCTVLLAEAYQRLDSVGRGRLERLVGEGTPEAVAELRVLLEEVGARAAVEERIAVLEKQAVEALSAASLVEREGVGASGGASGVREMLVDLVAAVTDG